MADLRTRYLGLELRTPIVASAGPLTGSIESLVRLEDAGVAAVVLPSLFVEELDREAIELHDVLEQGADWSPEASTFFPDMDGDGLGPQRHQRLLERSRAVLSIPVIASVNATAPGSWSRYAAGMADAGADAIELNLYAVPANPLETADEVESRYLRAIGEVRSAVEVPLAVKLSPFFSSPGHFAARALAAGADGLVLFNRFYQPDIDLETLDILPSVELSRPGELRLPLRWIALLRGHFPHACFAASTGIHSGTDVVKALLVGADVAMMTSALIHNGPGHVGAVEQELVAWLDEHEYDSVDQLRGSLSHLTAPDPERFERSNYIRVLSSIPPPRWE